MRAPPVPSASSRTREAYPLTSRTVWKTPSGIPSKLGSSPRASRRTAIAVGVVTKS